MKKPIVFFLAMLLMLTLAACGTALNPSNPTDSGNDEITDTEVRELFEKAAKEIITLASEDPTDVIRMILGDVEVIYEEKQINGEAYYETTADYKDLRDYYAEIFAGGALDWILSTKFADVDGTLYCSPSGGASGWRITNLEIKGTGQNSGKHMYEATFSEWEATTTSQFAIEKTEIGYRISSIDYIPDLLKTGNTSVPANDVSNPDDLAELIASFIGINGIDENTPGQEVILYTAVMSGITAQTWDDPNTIDPDCFILFYEYMSSPALRWNYEHYWDEDLEKVIPRCFDVKLETLRKSSYYDSDSGTYRRIDGLGGATNCRIVDFEAIDDNITLHYEVYQDAEFQYSGVLYTFTEISTYYLSNTVTSTVSAPQYS